MTTSEYAREGLSMATTRRSVNLLVPLVITTLTIVADQATKLLVLSSFRPGEILPIIDGLFNLTLTFNYGAAFGLWSWLAPGTRELVLALTILGAMVLVGFFLTRPYYRTLSAQIALSAILGGAIGNVIDRIRLGAVVDFLDFYVGNSHWPAFNVADSAICVGVAVLLLWVKSPAVADSSTVSE
jgi:signal peptidase II